MLQHYAKSLLEMTVKRPWEFIEAGEVYLYRGHGQAL